MIAVLGATGAVGAAAVRELARRGGESTVLRLGGRRAAALDALAASVPTDCESVPCDVYDDDSLDKFCAGASVVLHCAAPSFAIGERVAEAALRAGAHYVDVNGELPVFAALGGGSPADSFGAQGKAAVVSAGVIPGLSGLLPHLLASQFRTGGARNLGLTGWAGGVEPCSPGVGLDIPLSLTTGGTDGEAYGTALAAWIGGRRVTRALHADEEAQAPFFPGVVALQPYLSAENERVATAAQFDDFTWYNVHPGPRVREALNALPARQLDGVDAESLSAALVRAADLDLLGCDPYHLLIVAAHGRAGTRDVGGAIVVCSKDSYALSGFIAAHTVWSVLGGEVPAGVHFACDVLTPRRLLDEIADSAVSTVTELSGEDARLNSLGDEEEGAL
ncbi:saccharopine dehydrogenase NADP-binding domain-containing protein (plasmid) [Rhodococcus globerulus]|uniref:saccharopine dehydrogenase NADP-binding domain-containing protein n=1 Tax=Rhodococcus globerulus TaxID=33008 RepID=UPI0039E9734A